MTTSEAPGNESRISFLTRLKRVIPFGETSTLRPLSEAQASSLKAAECLVELGDNAMDARDRSRAGNNYLAAVRLYGDAIKCATLAWTASDEAGKAVTTSHEEHAGTTLNTEDEFWTGTRLSADVPFEELIALGLDERRQRAITLRKLLREALRKLTRRDSDAAIGVLARPFRDIMLISLCVGLIALVAYQWSHRTDLARSAVWRLSSSTGKCRPIDRGGCAPRQGVFFHTEQEQSPWIEYDLGRVQGFSRIVVENSRDGYRERAVPLIVEISDDQSNWREIARREAQFATWTSVFPAVTARFVRLRAAKQTYLHLARVEIRR
ncbi:MAG TPA: discoidin domain-containing protein [Polyangiaceae bacterium]